MRRSYLQHGRRHTLNDDPIPGVRRVCCGQVDGSVGDTGFGPGILDPGSGDWTVETDFGGVWTITFIGAFVHPPTVILTENATSTDPPSFIQETGVTVSGFTVSTFDTAGILSSDIGFNFEAREGG